MKQILIFLFILSGTILYAQNYNNFEKKISEKEIREDLLILKKNLETIHTGLYTYTDSLKMNSVFNQITASIDRPTSSIEFYQKLITLNQYIKNGHTFIKPSIEFEKKSINPLHYFLLKYIWIMMYCMF